MKRHYTLSGLLLCLMTLFTLSASAQPDKDYLCFTAKGASKIELKLNASTTYSTNTTIQYSKNKTGWTNVIFKKGTTSSQTTLTTGTISLNDGETIYFRSGSSSTAKNVSTSDQTYFQFVMSGSIAASGNVMSLVSSNCSETQIPCPYCFYRLFFNCKSLTSAPKLPATTLTQYCYDFMFYGCTSLTTAPELPARDVQGHCYDSMFGKCTSLTTAPELPATSLSQNCYNGMFIGCTSLTTAPELPAETLCTYCYADMFYGCTSLTTAPELPATTLADNCCQNMFRSCTSLTTAPELPATTLANNCYNGMFKECSNLNVVNVGFAELGTVITPTSNWLNAVAPKGIFICPSNHQIPAGVNGIPEGWSVNGFDLTVSAAGWASMYLPIDVTIPEDVEVYYAASASGDVVTLKPITDIIPAYTGVIVKADEGTVFFPYTTTAGTPVEGNLFEGVTSGTTCSAGENYVLAPTTTPDKPWFSNYTGTSLGAFKAYLPKSAVGGASSIQFRFADATAISSVETEVAEDVIYNLAGQRVGSDYRGIVIRNGKKMYNK